MHNHFKLTIIFFHMLHVSHCQQALNETSYEDEPEMDGTLQALVKMGRYWQKRLNITEIQKDPAYTEDVSKEASEDFVEDTRRLLGRYIRKERPQSKKYPTFVHCRGILPYCTKICIAINQKVCIEWPYMCPKDEHEDIPRRCSVQCIHNYRQMRLKFPNQLKLYRDSFEPRYNRFDYSEGGNGFPEYVLKANRGRHGEIIG